MGDPNPDIVALEMHPLPVDRPWLPSELILDDANGEQVGTYLAETRLIAQGSKGITLQARVGQHVEIHFRCPFEPASGGSADLNIGDLAGAPIGEAFDAADFMVSLDRAKILKIRVNNQPAAALDLSGRPVDSTLTDGFDSIRAVADDLKVVEAHTQMRFRYPRELHVVDRIMIRNVRLMLEGHCVVHPMANVFNANLSGERGEGLQQLLTTEPHWLVVTNDPGELELLGQTIQLPKLTYAAVTQLTDAQVDDLRTVLESEDITGRAISLPVRAGDRARMFLSDRFPADQPIDFTDWNIPGIDQQGLRSA